MSDLGEPVVKPVGRQDRLQSLAALLRRRAEESPDRGYTWLAQGEETADRLTYAGLDARARAIAAALAGAIPPGERALLLFPPGLEFIAAFFGCLYAGVIAVPAYPPHSRRPDPRLASIATDCRPRAVLTTAPLLARREALAVQVPALGNALWLGDFDPADRADPTDRTEPEDVAFLQYTSGSTGSPKGVVVTHANLLDNLEKIRLAFGQTPESVVVGWLPLFHDMGLIGNVLQPCFVGSDCVLMSPAAFLQKPARWLQAIHRFRGTTSGGPNFAYDLCARSVGPEVRAGLDLSSWSVAFNGAEPVRAETLRRFAEAFAPCGFRRSAFVPCYGLAEATLLVTAARGAADDSPVSCGALPPGGEVLVVDPEAGVPSAGEAVGEIWVSGPSVAAGYWNRPEETRETFGAVLQDGRGHPLRYLRTGDLGFVRGGELVVTGRLKDLIILRGRNLYPQDVELTAEQAHPALRAGGGAAFSVEEQGEERLVVVFEVGREAGRHPGELSTIADAIRRAVAEEHGVRVAGVALVRTGTIPKTSSGKIRRRECRARYLDGGLEILYRSSDQPPLQDTAGRLLTRFDLLDLDPEERAAALTAWLCAEIARRAGVGAERIGPETVIAAAGLDSLALFDLQGRLEADLGLPARGASLADLSVAGLRDLLLDQLAEPETTDLPPLVRGEVLGEHPLSLGQEALWFLEQSLAAEGVFHIAAAARLGTAVDGAALLRAALALVDRHPALRTTFGETGGEPRQRVYVHLAPDLAEVDATAWSSGELDDALRSEARRRFDLGGDSPLRLRIFHRPGGERILLLVLHHLVGDFWSLAVLLRDWAALYGGQDGGRLLPVLPAAYTDFVRQQRRLLDGPAGERLERFWLDRLRGAPLALDLPTDRPRPPAATHTGARLDLRLEPGLTGRLRELGGTQGATLFTTLLAGFQVLLGRLTGQDDFLLGAPTTGRRDRDLDGVVGYFVNPVVLRTDLTGDPPFAAFLARSRQTVSTALEHRDLPFAQLARLLQPVRDASRPPVVQAFFVLQQEPGLAAFAVGQAGARLEIDGLALESIRLDPGTAQLDLTLFAAEIEDAVVLSCEHDSALFDGVTIGRWLGHLQIVLEAAAAHPERRLGELPWLTGAERQQLFREWNDTAPAVPREAACLHELFAAQARRTPDAVAVIDGRREILYRELAAAAGRLAARLCGRGAGPEVVAGVCLERSAEMVVALLAILEAGAAWLPLDPRLPRRRLEGMLTGARAALVVSSGKLAAGLAWNGPVVLMDEIDEEDAEDGRASRWGRTDPASLAYVLYTSGSTGEPKGVAVTHRGAVELVRWAGTVYAPAELAGVLAATALSFDLSVFELFVPLCHGGTVILAGDVLDLPALPSAGRVTLVNTVPSAMAELVHAGRLGASVRTVNLAGEPLPRALAARLYATGTVERVWNLYGPSEDTTYSTCARVARDGLEAPRIGRPVTATRAHVLAGGLDPLPAGILGELYLGGAGLARGYLHRPGLTAERFLPDPFAEEPGARLYRTGDRVRWTAAGELEFLGRFDHQVKIRGFRIELGEIEAALLALPGVREAVVVAREDRLVAYVAGDGTVGELRQGLRERLPEHMVPAVFVALAALPRTASGKVDRQALPVPERQSAERVYRAPRTPVEEVVAGIWTELLGVPAGQQIGADDHFFDLGGHSLLATRVASRLRAAFGVEMPLRTLFEAPVLADLAARVEAARRSGAGPVAPPLVPVPREGPLPLSFAQQRLWLIDQLEPGSPLYNMPGALRIEGPLRSRVLALCLGEIVRRHEALRTVFAVRGDAPVQVIQPAAPFVLPVVDLSGLPEPTREAAATTLLAEEAVRPFDLARGPLVRGVLLRLAERVGKPHRSPIAPPPAGRGAPAPVLAARPPVRFPPLPAVGGAMGEGGQGGEVPTATFETPSEETHVLALTLHHIVSDGWSLGVLVRELTALYPELAAGRPSPLSELPVQSADFAVWQHSWLHGEVLENEIAFWRGQLAGLPPVLELPTDRPRPAVQSYRGGSRPVRLPAALTRQAEALARREGATMFMVLLAAFQALLARLSGQQDLAVGSPVAGRNRVETEGLIGFFVNTLVLRGDLSGAPTFRALLGRTRETALAAWLHQDVPFERLVEELAPERSLAQPPLFQVMLVLQNVPVESLEIESLRLQPVEVETVTATVAKFDLTLNLAEHGGVLGSLAGTVEYATALFDGTTIDRLIDQYERLLTAALAAPELPALELPLLSAAERHQLLREWSDTAAVFPQEATLHGLFAEQAELRPDAVAVEQGGERLTYGELRRRAGRIARRLVARGLRPEERVAVLAERSPDLIAELLGILEAGGAYLPLDPASPAERLHWMLRDAGATLLVDTPEGEENPPLPAVPAESLAYVMYTSGSTGTPKDVAVTHRNVIRLVRGAGYADFGPEQTWLQYAPVSFDASTLEIWAPLLNGGRLVLFPGRIGSLDELARVVETHGVTSAWLTAGLFHEMVDGCLAGLRPLSQLLAGGDVVSPIHARRVLEAHPGLTLINGYGPTEGTTFTCCHRMTEARQVGGDGIPIGRPIANARVRVLDERLDPVPVGVWGELYAGGDGLARGYLGRPELTAERFVPDAFGEAGGRLYRTGDRVRQRADGLLEFSGRLDDQVKIRGFRIEPGEIEAALMELPGVREAVVVARWDQAGERVFGNPHRWTLTPDPSPTAPPPAGRGAPAPALAAQTPVRFPPLPADGRAVGEGGQGGEGPTVAFKTSSEIRLVAYVAGEVAPEELRRHLRERLPDSMVPAAFVTLAALPLTANGKVDRKALPAPEWPAAAASPLAPRTPVEEILAGIWSELLGVERIGVTGHFFELGGHSLLATQAVSRLRGAFGVELPVRDLFEAPVLADLAVRVEAALQASLHSSSHSPSAPAPPLVPVPREGPLPLSFAQQRLWFIDQLAPGNPLYNVPVALRVEGPLRADLLARCLGEIVRRHEALRTVFIARDGAPVQVIQPAVPFVLPVVDLSGLAEKEREAAALALAGEEAVRPFNLARDPMLRGLLVRIGDSAETGDHLAALTMHHIASDGWSMGVLVREVAALYGAQPSPLPELPVQYADFSAWQASWLRGEVLESEIAFWRRQLAGLPPLLELPTDRPRPAVQSFRGTSRPLRLPAALARQAEEFARREGATLFIVLLAVFQTFLARTSGRRDLAVGSPIAGRNRLEIEGLIGFFVNTLVLRGDLSGDGAGEPTFRELLGRVRETALAAWLHQDVPFEKLVEELAPERSLAHAPLFQVMLVLQNAPTGSLEIERLRLRPVHVDGTTAKFDLTVSFAADTEGMGGLSGFAEHASDLFDTTTVDRWLGHFERLLAAALTRSGEPVFELPLLGEAERFQILVEWNDTAPAAVPTSMAPYGGVWELFADQARRTPDAVALVCGSAELTYAELTGRAGRLAVCLRRLGVGPDVLVGLFAERSLDMIAGVLGIFQAGGVCVPLDTRHPAQRLAFLLDDTRAPVVLTQAHLRDRLPAVGGAEVLLLDGDEITGAETAEGASQVTVGTSPPWPPSPIAPPPAGRGGNRTGGRAAGMGGGAPLPVDGGAMGEGTGVRSNGSAFQTLSETAPDNLAYIVFTSGSTGRPKGVALSQGALRNVIDWHVAAFLGGVRTLQFALLSFDVSFYEMFVCWASGGTLVMVPDESRRDMPALAGLLVEQRIEKAILPVVVLQQLAELFAGRRDLPPLREITSTGERLQTSRAMAALFRRLPGCAFHNHYGPSETHVATAYTLHPDPRSWAAEPPIGRPIQGSSAHVLTPGLLPAPVGVPGDLHLGGVCLARGYLGRPGLTAERFIPDPFGAPGSRLYRTGDKVRLLANGDLEYLGRLDDQIKIRGFRIEPGEIEAALVALPGVREAVVMARESTPGNPRLIAYVVGDRAPEELRRGLRERLPEHMVPAVFVRLAALPTTPNGKVDRKALPVPESTLPEAAGLEPRTPVETILAGIWCEVLEVPRVGFEENFFDLGGHSLLLPKLQARVRDRIGREVSLVELLTHTSVRALASHLEPPGETVPAMSATPAVRAAGGAGDGAIAVIGLAGRFPGADGVEQLWANLCAGVSSIARFSAAELAAAGVDPALARDPRYVPAAGAIDGVELFDAGFFGYSPREAEILDPQQRVFLECAWEALENAGYDSARTPGPVGVFAGLGFNLYLHQLLAGLDRSTVGDLQLLLGNDKDFLPTRTSYKLDLKGPSMAVQTACSSSLVAVHLACQNLLLGACDMALAGGVSISLPQRAGYLYQEGGILSPDGCCRAFDAEARGSVPASGAGIVVLKRLADALEQGDTIRAVLRGSAVNNDGSGKAGYTAPSVAGQAEVITAALAAAGIDPATVSYVETHGTGTVLGDPIEVEALTRAFLRGGPRERSCALGSVKSNLGHLNAAAGVTGLIKTVLALQHGVLPPSRDFSRPNPRIDFTAVPFHVQTETAAWERDGTPRRAGVSSFGIGGTNAHVVLEEAPAAEPSGPSRPWQVLLLSARTSEALDAVTDRLVAHLDAAPGSSLPVLPDIAYTLRAGRRPFAHRRAVVAASREEAVAALRSRDPKRVWTASQEPGRRSVAFLLPGVGDQYPGIARGLYHEEPVFRREIDRCAELLLPHLGLDLREVLFAGDAGDEEDEGKAPGLHALLGREPAARTLLGETHIAQPAMFALGYALARLWMSWNVQPAALLGYSLGEYTAACLAGVMELPNALALVARRARLIGDLAPGAMLAVPLSEEETRARLDSDLSLAAVNAPAVSVVAGPPGAIAGLERRLAEEGLPCRRLQAAQAFHSWTMQPAAEALRELVRSIPLAPPRIPWLSNVTGTWIEPSQATDPDYWVSHLLSTVRFAGGIAELWREPGRILLEMGPGQTLGSLALQQIPEGGADRAVLSSLRHPLDRQPDQRFLLHSLGRLWLAGAEIDWSGFHGGERRRRVPLPAYPFERQRYWIEPGIEPGQTVLKTADGAGWFHAPSWKRDPHPRSAAPVDPAGRWLVLLDPLGLGDLLARRLTAAGCAVATVRLDQAGDFDALLSGLSWRPDRVLHLWSLGAPDEPAGGGRDLTGLARVLAGRKGEGPAEICVIADGLCDVERKDLLHPGKAALLGPLRVIPREHPGISCRLIDVNIGDIGEIGPKLEARLLADLTERTAEPVVAWRGPYRWLPVFEPVALAPAALHKAGGTYLMIGAAGSDLAGPLEAAGAAVSVLAAEEVNETVLDRAAEAARRDDPSGFLVLFSALDALAGVGAIVGAFARERSARGEMPVTAIHWGRGLTVEERLDALGRILESGLPEVVVSPGDLAKAIREAAAPAEALAASIGVAPSRKRHPRPALQTPWAAPATATEETVAGLWGELLGIEPIGVHDNFFELGGHSLLGLQAVSRIQARLGAELSLRTLFEAPTVGALAAEVDAYRLRGETAAEVAIAAVPRDGRPLPLSFAQQRLWFIDQLEPGSPLYNLPAVLRAEGPLDSQVLARCLGEVVRRHEALRTVFAVFEGADGAPVQVIQPAAPFLLPVVDLSGLPESRRETAARTLAGEGVGRPFDLRRDSMLRGVLLRLAEEDHVAALTMHHIASDGWSIGILIREVTVLYDLFATGQASPLPELQVQYADFSAWQSSWLRGEVLENEISFWRRQLAGLPPLLELPTDRPRPAVQSYRGASRPVRLPAALTRKAEALGRHDGATFFMVLLAGFQALLARTSGQDDLATGSPIAGRNRMETEDLIGFFVNTLVLRGDLTGDPSFRELLGRTRETALSAYLHQDLPFEKLVEELAPERSLAQTPLFQVMLVLQNAPMGSLEIRDLRLRLLTTEATTAKLDLTVNVTERDGALDGEIEYATDLFDAATIDRLAGHWERLLAAAVEAPGRRTAELPLLSAAERGQILLEWNDTGPAAPRLLPEAGAPELFAAQARRTPDAVAVVCGHDHQKAALTYAELAARAGRLARHLRRLGVGPDVLVGLFVERSLDMAVGVLGILQAGGAYVPLDPGYPEQRLAFMLDDTRAPVVVTQEPLRGRLPAGGGAEILLLDGDDIGDDGDGGAETAEGVSQVTVGTSPPWPPSVSSDGAPPPAGRGGNRTGDRASGTGAGAPLPVEGGAMGEGTGVRFQRCGLPSTLSEPAAENLAYVIYTSGSTGRPKGVALSHGALRNLIDWHLATCLGGVRTLQIASMSFDVSFYEMFACWGSGGTLVVVEEELRRDMPALADLLVEQQVEKAVFPVAVFAQLAEIFAGRAELPPLREITTTGERLQTNRAMAALLDGLPGCVFHNQYGPTETHVATAFTLPSGPGDWPVFPAIGRPIWGSTAYVLEPGLEPAPAGVPGDLHLGGACVARGYLGRPALTAERFVPDPFSTVPGGRLYRTGDKVRLAVGGELEYLGRLDHQVKIRGFRIEPGEIEEALLALPGVREAVVLAREDRPAGERRLVAYVVGTTAAGELRSALRERLPDYMVPAAFVTLAAFPLTPNRKVDRKALPEPESESTGDAGDGYVAPRTPVEEVLAGIWAELLGLERVGADGSFFELGGHSLLATQVMSRLRGAFGIEMPLRDLFEAPTPVGLAVRIETARRAAEASAPLASLVPLVPLVPALRQGPLPLSFAQQRLWLIDQLAPGSPTYHMPLVLRVEGPLDPAVLARSLSEIVRRHEALRTVFAVREGTPVQVIRPAVPFVLPVVDLSALPESRRAALALLLAQGEALRPFDLARDPLLRGVLLRIADSGGTTDHLAALTMHHIASDGWSLGILVREITILYAAFAAGRPSPLPELPVQYADFAVWQGSWLRGELLENEIAFWRRQLAGLPPHLDLPTDRPRSTMRSLRGTSRPVRLPAGIARLAEALARREGATLFMVLLAGFQALLARLSGQDDLAVGSPIAGRNRVETEGLIGFFVNTLVLRGDLSGAPTFRELLGRTRETALAAYLHQDVPFEKLVEELVPERSLAQTPLFQVMLVLQNVPVESLEMESLRLRPVDVETRVAKFDLTLSLAEHGGALAGTVEYATALFDATTIGRLTGCFERLLAAALAAPELPALELALLSAAEQHQLLREWSDTAAVFPREATLHGLFAEQAEQRPDAVAVEQGGESLTYGELRRRAGRIARRLVALGLRPEERVAVLAERSPDLIAALLGILEAGGAYLPLDPASPADRLDWMLRDAGATLLVDLLDPRDDGEEPAAGPSMPALSNIPAESLAYVMYTSGSTGTPKGVAVTHRNVIRLVRGAEYADFGPEQIWLQYAPVSFDASTLEIWAPLLNGGRLVLFPGRTGSLDELARVVETHGVTSAWLTAGLFHEMVDGCLAGLRPLSQLLAGGDVVSPVHARRVLEAHPGLTLIDGYGPTEGTTFTCCHRMTEARQVGGDGIPIGRPIGNAQVRVLDERLAPVPIGAWGELYAGGDGLARGYLGRPELTAEHFVPDDFVPDAFGEAGSRLYRTGDRVRHRADGLLEFSGRLDGQVKIRGFRIEPGEIEAALVAHPGVREAVVVVRRDRDREIRLVAYVAGNVPGMAAEELRRHLRERLPEPMVPATFVVLAALPLTANGKVDRKALPAPAEAAGELQASHVPPRTDLEELIARVWCEVLGVERVGVHDGFFDLGGHSLLLLRVVSRLREVLGRDLPNVLLFEYPTVASLAAALDGSPNLPAAPAPDLEHSRDRAAARRESLRRLQRRAKRNA